MSVKHRTRIIAAVQLCLIAGFSHSNEETTNEFASVKEIIRSCEVCHGENGASTQQQYPILGGQEFYYLYVQLKDFKSGLRSGPIMEPLVADLDKGQMQLVAKYFSEQPWPETTYPVEDERRKSARSVIAAGQCVACHLGSFHGDSRVPRLAGQHPEYLEKTMLDFKTKTRKNSPAKSSLMASFEEDQIANVARYLGALGD